MQGVLPENIVPPATTSIARKKSAKTTKSHSETKGTTWMNVTMLYDMTGIVVIILNIIGEINAARAWMMTVAAMISMIHGLPGTS